MLLIFWWYDNCLANKSIVTCGCTFNGWSVSLMISSLSDYGKPLINHVGSISLSKFTTHNLNDQLHYSSKIPIPSPV